MNARASMADLQQMESNVSQGASLALLDLHRCAVYTFVAKRLFSYLFWVVKNVTLSRVVNRPTASVQLLMMDLYFCYNTPSLLYGFPACLKGMDYWLGGLQWDVVTINFGLHDCEPGGDSAGYAKNLETILSKSRAAAGATIFVTTTPFWKYKEYNLPCVVEYNKVARQVIASLNSNGGKMERIQAANVNGNNPNKTIGVADLYAHVESYCGVNYTTCTYVCCMSCTGGFYGSCALLLCFGSLFLFRGV